MTALAAELKNNYKDILKPAFVLFVITAVVVGLLALGDLSAVHPLSAFGVDGGDGAPRGVADLALSLLHGSHSFLSVILR